MLCYASKASLIVLLLNLCYSQTFVSNKEYFIWHCTVRSLRATKLVSLLFTQNRDEDCLRRFCGMDNPSEFTLWYGKLF